MDPNRHIPWEAGDDVPSMLALVIVTGLWGLFSMAATIYYSSVGY